MTDDPVEEGSRLLALLMFAAGFVLGLFFGWLLHRERVERALYEDVVRARDRATSTLAETSARLELANRDAVRLRGQLTDAQHELTERDTTIARLRREAEADDVPQVTPEDAEALAEAGFEESDVTEEVVPTGELVLEGAADAEGELVEEAEEDLELVDEEDLELVELAPGDDVVEDDDELVAAGAWYDREPVADDGPASDDAATREGDGPPSDDAPTPAVEPADTAPAGGGSVDSGIGTPLVLEADADDTARPPLPEIADEGAPVDDAGAGDDVTADDVTADEPAADDLRRIAGVGPALERALHSEGITTYRQLALLDDRTISELAGRRPRLANRLRRDDWIAQARRLHQDLHGTPI